ncbi:MAG: ABC transporter ATP-binding protein [Lachnospiraceae bacterium]|nr:ABC transporter ATP-binding protein [Lachnospiraceae bacterium]
MNTNAAGKCLETVSLSAGYGKHVIIYDADLSFTAGSIVTLIGANGSGKSTLLKTLCGELKPLNGTVRLSGPDGDRTITEIPAKELSKRIAILMTDKFRSGFMKVKEIVELGRYPYTGLTGMLSKTDKEAVEKALSLLKLTELADQLFSELSDGQRQLVMLARAICQEPEILIMDEPTSFLDINYKLALLRIIRALSDKGITVILSLHELELAKEIADSCVCIREGHILPVCAPSEVFTPDILGEIFGISEFGPFQRILF